MKDSTKTPSLQWEYVVLGVSLLLILAILALVFPYCSYQADDFCRAASGAESSVIANVTREYFQWSGRWLGIGIEYSVLTASNELLTYRLTLALALLSYLACLSYLIGTLFPQLSRGPHYLLTGSLFGLYWSALPETWDTIYWLCGAVEYQLSIALGALSFAAALRLALRNYDWRSRAGLLILSTLAAFAVTGIHELYGLMLCIVILSAALLAWLRGSASRWVWSWIAGVALTGFLIAYFAPGHRFRIQGSGNYGKPMLAFQGAVRTACAMLPDWVFDPRLFLATFLFVLLLRTRRMAVPWLSDELGRQLRWVVPMVWFVLMAGSFAGPAWGTGGTVASRTLAPTYMIFLLGWFVNWTLFSHWLQSKDVGWPALPSVGNKALVLFFAASLLLTGNTRRAVRELSGPLQQYAAAKQNRDELLRKGGEHEVVVVPPLPIKSELIGFGDLTNNPKNWINRCTALYYGVKAIQIEEVESKSEPVARNRE